MTTKVNLNIVNFCARECKLQMSGELSVAWMVDAWLYAIERSLSNDDGWTYTLPTVDDVINLGRLCEPDENRNGFRTCWVQVRASTIDWQNIHSQIDSLILHGLTTLTPAEFFKEYEEIHPFRDGNGRSGQILFNWLNTTLNSPEWAPNFFNDPRRTIGRGA